MSIPSTETQYDIDRVLYQYMFQQDHSSIALKFDNKIRIEDDDSNEFGHLIVKHKHRIIKLAAKALEQYKSMQINMRLHPTCEQLMECFDGEKYAERREVHLGNKQVHRITQSKFESAIREQTKDNTSMI